MKKIIWFLLALLLVSFAYAAEVCIVAQTDEDSVKSDCVNVPDGTDGYSVLQESSLDFLWSDEGIYGRALCKIEGKGDSVSGTVCAWGTNYWGFYMIRNDEWTYLPVGFDSPGGCWNGRMDSYGGHYCAKDGDVLGFRYGQFGTKPDMLYIDELNIYVDGDKSSADESGGKIKDVSPESELEIKSTVKNLYPDDLDVKISDITIEATIYDIDDGDDITEESDSIDLSSEEDDEIAMTIDIPLRVKDGSYDMELLFSAEDENGINYNKTIEYKLELTKEKHELKFLNAELDQETINCRGSILLDVEIANIGKDSEDVTLTVSNQRLGISLKDDFTLDDDPFDDDSRYQKKYDLVVDNVLGGTYPISIKAQYSGKELTKTVNLNVNSCGDAVTEEKESDIESNGINKEEVQAITISSQNLDTPQAQAKPSAENYIMPLIIVTVVVIFLIFFVGALIFVLKR